MNASTEIATLVAHYDLGLLALVVLCLLTLIQSFATAIAFSDGSQTPGLPLKGDHQSRSFRIVRAYANATENLPAFGFALLTAILVGANPTLVNWLATIFVLFRVAFSAVYYAGFGIVTGGPRTMCYVGGLVTNILLTLTAIWAAVT